MRRVKWCVANPRSIGQSDCGVHDDLESARRSVDASGLFRAGLALIATEAATGQLLGDTETAAGWQALARHGLLRHSRRLEQCMLAVVAAMAIGSVVFMAGLYRLVEANLGFTEAMAARDLRAEQCAYMFAMWTTGVFWGSWRGTYRPSVRLREAFAFYGGLGLAGCVVSIWATFGRPTVPMAMFTAIAASGAGVLLAWRLRR